MTETNLSFKQVLQAVRKQFPSLILISSLVNILMLVTAIYMLQIYDRVLSSGSFNTLIWLSVIALFAILMYGVLEQSRRLILSRTAGYLDNELNEPVLKQAMAHRLAGEDSEAGVRDVSDLRNFYQSDAALSLLDAPWSLVFIAFVWALHPVLGTVALFGAIILFLSTLANDILTRNRQMAAAAKTRKAQESAVRFVDGAETIGPMGMANSIFSTWRNAHGEARAEQQSLTETTLTIVSFTRALRFALQIMLLGIGAYFVLGGELTPGAMIAASIIGGRALSPIERLTAGWRRFVAAREARRRLSNLFDKIDNQSPSISLPKPEGRVDVENVSYLSPVSPKPILQNINFSLSPGEACAVVGPSGAGKSTLCRQLVGAWRPTSGNVRLDGAEIHAWESEELGPNLGYLPQKVELFPGTVAENIARFGPLDSKAVVAAAKVAGVHGMILRLPKGYETQVGAHGSNVSLGQSQRIGLARAVYREPALVVLDEPNSNLDQSGDRALLLAIAKLKGNGSTVIAVSHRPELLKEMDHVLMLQAGQVVKFAPCKELLRPSASVSARAKVKDKATDSSALDRKKSIKSGK